MSWRDVLIAMLPEHLLLAGIVALIVLEIASSRPRGALAAVAARRSPRRRRGRLRLRSAATLPRRSRAITR